MGLMLAYPQRMGGGWQEQMNALYKSQCEVIDQLNLADWSAEAVLKEITQGIDEDAALKTQQEKNLTGFASLKQLVIQTADFAMENSEVFTKVFSGSYVAKSDFGEYVKNTQLTLEANSEGITQLYEYTDGINNQYTGQSRQYVKTGLLYYDGVTPRYGVGVGNISTKIQSGKEVIDQSAGEAVTVTPGRLSFWQQGLEVAYLTDKVLHFPSGTLEAAGAKISGTLEAAAGSKIGAWTVAADGLWWNASGFGNKNGLYFGTSGISVLDKFKVDAAGNMVTSSLKLKNANGEQDVFDALLTLTDEVEKLNALTDMLMMDQDKVTGLNLVNNEGDGLTVTGSSSGSYAVQLASKAALRIQAGNGSLYMANQDDTAYIQIYKDGTIKFQATAVTGLDSMIPVFG